MSLSLLYDIFLDPPTDAIAKYALVPLVFGIAMAVISAVSGVIYTRRTGSPLYIWSAIAGYLGYTFVVEPVGDWPVACWYSDNQAIALTVLDRPMPVWLMLLYGAGIPAVVTSAWEIAKRGLPGTRLLQLIAGVAVIQVPFEIIAAHFGWMTYYGQHATIFAEPIYCFVQNAGMFAVVAWTLSWLLPHIRGWRWTLVPIVLVFTLPVYALVSTFPSYIAIHTGAGPAVSWAAGILSTILNAAVMLACIYSPQLQRLREARQTTLTETEHQRACRVAAAS